MSRWIKPRWGGHRLNDVKTIAVEQWLRKIERNAAVGVMKKLLHRLHMLSMRLENRCIRMAEGVPADLGGDIRFLERWLDVRPAD